MIERLKQRFERLQAVVTCSAATSRSSCPPGAQQPLHRTVAEVAFFPQDLHQHGHPQQPLGDQLGHRRSGDGSRADRAGPCPLVTSPPEATAIGRDLDLDLFGIPVSLGENGAPQPGSSAGARATRGFPRRPASDGSRRFGPGRSVRWPRRAGSVGAGSSSSPSRQLERSQTKPFRSFDRLVLELAILTAKLCDLLFQLGDFAWPLAC